MLLAANTDRISDTCRESVASAWGSPDAWNNEYANVRSIPSSRRATPSRAFRRLAPAIGDLRGARVLDVGAGTGRHAIFAARQGARVHAIDASDVACDILRTRADKAECAANIVVQCGRIGTDGFPTEKYDVVIDSYATCHILSARLRIEILDELMVCMARHGRLYTAGMGDRDSFYRAHSIGSGGGDVVAVDPSNGIAKLLQSSELVAQDAERVGTRVARTTERFVDHVGGSQYWRHVCASVFTR